MSSGPKRVTIRRVHSWIRHMMLQQMQNHTSSYVNHDGVISGMPLMRIRPVVGPTLQYMPDPRTVTQSAGSIQYDLTII